MPKSVTPHDLPKRCPKRRSYVLESYACWCRAFSGNSVRSQYCTIAALSTTHRYNWTTVRPFNGIPYNVDLRAIDFGIGVGANDVQIGYPTRSPKKVSKTSILRIGIVRFLVPGMFRKFCPAVVLYHRSTVYDTSIRLDDGTTIQWKTVQFRSACT